MVGWSVNAEFAWRNWGNPQKVLSWCPSPGPELKPGSPEYEAGVIPNRPRGFDLEALNLRILLQVVPTEGSAQYRFQHYTKATDTCPMGWSPTLLQATTLPPRPHFPTFHLSHLVILLKEMLVVLPMW
jgi:hypothetical protein